MFAYNGCKISVALHFKNLGWQDTHFLQPAAQSCRHSSVCLCDVNVKAHPPHSKHSNNEKISYAVNAIMTHQKNYSPARVIAVR